MRFSRALLACVFLSVFPWPALSQAKSEQATTPSVSAFVQKFYDWYLKKAKAGNGTPAWSFLLDTPPAALSPDLISALKLDAEAQRKVKDDNVGLDFDPFLNSQDPCDRYVVGKTISRAEHSLVEVYCVQSGRREGKPAVLADVIQKNGQWLIVNFVYVDPDDTMLSMLKLLREERKKEGH